MTTHLSLSLAKCALWLLRIAYMLRRLMFGSSLESDRSSGTWVWHHPTWLKFPVLEGSMWKIVAKTRTVLPAKNPFRQLTG
jgi:hypothetical protein